MQEHIIGFDEDCWCDPEVIVVEPSEAETTQED